MKNAIASAHWEACLTCAHSKDDGGCNLPSVDLDVFLGDWIVCQNYEPLPETTNRE